MATENNSDAFDYELWAPAAKATLIEKGVWDVVENGVSPYPLKIPELAATVKAEKLSRWRDLLLKDMKALHVLQSTLTDSGFRKKLSASSAKEVWDLLEKSNYEAKVRRLEEEFEEISIRENESDDAYFDRVDELVEQLRSLKVEISDFEFIEKLLVSSPGANDGVVTLLKELDEVHHVTFESLVEKLFTHGNGFRSVTKEVLLRIVNVIKSESGKWCNVCNKNNHNQEECRSIPKVGNSSGAKLGRPKKGECFQCGHKAKDCDIRIEEIEEEEEDDGIVVDYVMAAKVDLSDSTYDEDMWMVSAFATIHMTRYEKFFTALDRTEKAKVGLVDGTVLMAEGKGDVKIMMKEGKKKTISNVLFVPGINGNVLSLSQMKSRGYSFSEEKRGECIIRDRTGAEFGEAMWVGKELALRLRVIEGKLTF